MGGERDVGKAWKVGDVPYGEVELKRERIKKMVDYNDR